MIKNKFFFRFLDGSALISLLSCESAQINSAGQGVLAYQVLWPSSNFRVQRIPDQTEAIEIQLQSQNGEQNLSKTLHRAGNESTVGSAKVRFKLSSGTWRVTVNARNAAQEIVAGAVQTVKIRAGQITQADLDLQTGGSQTPTNPELPAGDGKPDQKPDPGLTPPTPEPPSQPGSPSSPEPIASSSPTPAPLPSPTATPYSGGSGGSSGGSGGSSNPNTSPDQQQITGLSASLTELSGLGYASELIATVSTAASQASPGSFSWSCKDANNVPGCGSFSIDSTGQKAVWTAPGSSNGGSNGEDIYTLTVTLNLGGANPSSQSIPISVKYGSGAAGFGPGEFDGGQ